METPWQAAGVTLLASARLLAHLMPQTTIVIPARLGSTRFPEKVLASETGRPLIQHVYEAARGSARAAQVLIATDHERVRAAATAFGAQCVMTAESHPNGTSRIAEVCDKLGLADDEVIVNVQGDEPDLDPSVIDALIDTMTTSSSPMATIASPFAEGEDAADPNIVKVVVGVNGSALYFSRARIPLDRDRAGGSAPARPLKHIGLYAYRRAFLRTYTALPPTPLEQTEKLEQLRVLEHGHSIAVAVRNVVSHGIDTREQYDAFVKRWKSANRA